MNQCYDCEHRGEIPGSAESCCKFPGNKTDFSDLMDEANHRNAINLGIEADPKGLREGFFFWPVRFDPIWLINCKGLKKHGND